VFEPQQEAASAVCWSAACLRKKKEEGEAGGEVFPAQRHAQKLASLFAAWPVQKKMLVAMPHGKRGAARGQKAAPPHSA